MVQALRPAAAACPSQAAPTWLKLKWYTRLGSTSISVGAGVAATACDARSLFRRDASGRVCGCLLDMQVWQGQEIFLIEVMQMGTCAWQARQQHFTFWSAHALHACMPP